MSASLASGTYGRQPALGSTVRQFFSALLGATPAPTDRTSRRVREANEVRALARSVETANPGFAADLYAAASRHEGLDD